ncbi:MAG: hypothetical protein HY816_18750 [Candidatus Wallbacteria bacterium]|nr:hypothetical protein [Candidatus Wallbacteria bacterium]
MAKKRRDPAKSREGRAPLAAPPERDAAPSSHTPELSAHGAGSTAPQIDRHVPGVAAMAVALVALVVGSMALMQGLVSFLSDTRLGRSAAAPLPVDSAGLRPAEGARSIAYQQRLALESRERALLTTYEWVDPAAGVIRIPVDRAIELLSERPLPHRTPPAVIR